LAYFITLQVEAINLRCEVKMSDYSHPTLVSIKGISSCQSLWRLIMPLLVCDNAGMLHTYDYMSFSLTGDWTIFMRCLLILVTMAGMSTTPSWAACSRAVSMAISVPVLPTPALQGDSHHQGDESFLPWNIPLSSPPRIYISY